MNDTGPASELSALLDATVDAVILIDSRGCIEVFNQAAERLYGYAAAEVLGRNVNLLMADKDRNNHDAYMERYERTGVAHIIGIGREVENRRKDGSVFPGFLSVGRIAKTHPPRYVGFVHDLTLRHQALAAVVRERDRANRYLEAVQAVLVVLDPNRRVTLVNRKGCEVLDAEERTLLGAEWFEAVVPAEERAGASAQFHAFLERHAQGPVYDEYRVCRPGGEMRTIAWRYVAIADAVGAVTGVLCSGDDVTDARRAEADARQAHERITHVSRLATMGEMASGISHEINQPLSAITTYAQAARRLLQADQSHNEAVREALEQIAAQALRAGEIIRRLRSLVRSRETQREPVQINVLIEDLGPLTRADARMNDVRISLDLGADLLWVDIDPIQIQQVLLNLVRNAVQAVDCREHGKREIVIHTEMHGEDQLEVRVCDNGSGVSAEFLPRLFTQFATTKSDGTGLGLAISRSIIEAHRGKIEYQPNVPEGSCFLFRLPVIQETRS